MRWILHAVSEPLEQIGASVNGARLRAEYSVQSVLFVLYALLPSFPAGAANAFFFCVLDVSSADTHGTRGGLGWAGSKPSYPPEDNVFTPPTLVRGAFSRLSGHGCNNGWLLREDD